MKTQAIDIDSEDEVRILSLDGGGIRGFTLLRFLEQLETTTGQPTSKIFHLMVGTSIGGHFVNSLGLPKDQHDILKGPKYSAKEIIDIYEKERYKLLSPNWWGCWGLTGPIYDQSSTMRVTDQYFGDTLFNNSVTNTMVLAYNYQNNRPFFFESWNKRQKFRRSDVTLATTAAPFYFPPRLVRDLNKNVDHPEYILGDGGLFANNPVFYALLAARELYPNASRFRIVSIGTGQCIQQFSYKKMKTAGALKWVNNIPDILMGCQTNFVHANIGQVLKNSYSRWNPVIKKEHAVIDRLDERNIRYLLKVVDKMIEERRDEFNRLVEILKRSRPLIAQEDYAVDGRSSIHDHLVKMWSGPSPTKPLRAKL